MAEVATKKSINVVSSKKSDVCGVQSNNGLIDLDNISASNNQLIALCDNNDDDDDLVLTNNSRNELDGEDQSLQELIENELALRICSKNDSNEDDDEVVEETIEDVPNATSNQPETVKRIVLDRQQQEHVDVNAEFIIAETEHCALIEEPYGYQNGHATPDASVLRATYGDENAKPEPVTTTTVDNFRDNKETQEEKDRWNAVENEDDSKDPQVFDEQPEGSGVMITIRKTSDDSIDPSRRSEPREEEEVDEKLFARYDQEEQGEFRCVAKDHYARTIDDLSTSDDPAERADDKDDVAARNTILPDDVESCPPMSCPDKYHDEEEEPNRSKVLEDSDENILLMDACSQVHEELTRASVDLLDTWTDNVPSAESHQAGQFSDNFDETLCQENQTAEDLVRESKQKIEVRDRRLALELDGTSGGDGFFRTIDGTPEDEELQAGIGEHRHSSFDDSKDATVRTVSPLEGIDDIVQSRSFDEGTPSQSDAASTQEFIDTERRILTEESADPDVQKPVDTPDTLTSEDVDRQMEDMASKGAPGEEVILSERKLSIEEDEKEVFVDRKFEEGSSETIPELEARETLDSWVTVEEATKPENDSSEDRLQEQDDMCDDHEVQDTSMVDEETEGDEEFESPVSRAPLATPDETSDFSNTFDSESREETISTSSSVVTSSSTIKGGTKTKKKKIEGVSGNDASPNLTPRTKKTKKSKKSDLEKENISVNCNFQDPSMLMGTREPQPEMIDFSDEYDLSNVNVKSLTQSYVSEANRHDHEKCGKEKIATGVSIKQLCRSFGDISNVTEHDQIDFAKTNQTMEHDEKARSMGDLRLCEQSFSRHTVDAPVFVGVSVKALRASYCSLASLQSEGKDEVRPLERVRCEKSSFNKFDALSKKTVLHVRSVDAGKVQQQLNAVGQNGDNTNPNCRSCGKVVFQMEQTKAEGLVWHKNCFRCVQCSKQLNVDNYESHESTLYCKPHFKELFQPKPVEESDQPVRPRKPEMIIRENEPKELPPDVVRASDKPDLGLEELSSLNVKSRFQVFEKAGTENANEIERSPSQIAVKRSPSILSKLAKFQAKGMDIGVADESLNGIPYEASSESEEDIDGEENEEVDTEIVKAKRATRERPISFSKMDDIKNRWETTSQQGRREVQREARKEEIAGIRSRLFMGKQGKMKEMYQQAVAGSDRVTKINAAEEIQHSTHARSIKERFERGEPIAASDDEMDNKPKPEKADEEVIAAGISRKSRSLFLELDASAAKTGRPVTPVNPKTPADAPRRARDAFMGRQVSEDVVRSTDTTAEVQVETSDISNKFKFFETYKEPEKQRKQFRITPPRDGQVKMDSPEREIYRDPDVVRAEDRVNEVVHTDTARKMLTIFRQMEENACKEELPDGPKPLKRFTPPPEDKFAKPTASDSEEDEEEEGEESEAEDSNEERDPNYVRASDKVEDEFLKQAQNAARAKTLRLKFEHWEETDGKVSNQHHTPEMDMAQGEQSSIESASSLRAHFESLGSQSNESPRTPKVKVNRFVEIQSGCTDVCESCEKKVYPLEKVETNNKIFHKQCFRCLQCNCILRMDTFTLNNGKLYCIPHFKQLFITRGNYDEGFGVDPHKNKWATASPNGPATPIAVTNGDV